MTSNEVRGIRERLGVSRKEFAQRLSVPYETLCRWENGNRSPSKIYEAKLRELSGRGCSQVQELWIFLGSNLLRVKRAVAERQGLVLGTVHAPLDPSNQFVLARIRLRPEAHSLKDLGRYFSAPPRPEMRIVGFFAAGDGDIRPVGWILQCMVAERSRGGDCCVLFSRDRQIITVWRLCPWPPADITQDSQCARPIPHRVLGEAQDMG